MTRYVICGGSAAGATAAAAIRGRDETAEIIICDRDSHSFYYRLNLDSYIAGECPREQLPCWKAERWQQLRLDLRLNTEVVSCDLKSQTVTLADGTLITFDKLLLAPGSAPLRPQWPGSELANIFTFRTLNDADNILRQAKSSESAVVVGGGVLGLVLAEALSANCPKTTLLVREEFCWPQQFDRETATIIQEKLAGRGVILRLGELVEEFIGANSVAAVRTNQAEIIAAQMICVCIGVRPDVGFLAESGLGLNPGITINERFQTSFPNVYAAGDAAQGWDSLLQMKRINTTWAGAIRAGKLCGEIMAGADASQPPDCNDFAETFCRIPVRCIGITDASQAEIETYTRTEESAHRRLNFRNGALVGTILAGNTKPAGKLKQLILSGTQLSAAQREELLSD
jgi:nitrite reductase (NADH) large subunit